MAAMTVHLDVVSAEAEVIFWFSRVYSSIW